MRTKKRRVGERRGGEETRRTLLDHSVSETSITHPPKMICPLEITKEQKEVSSVAAGERGDERRAKTHQIDLSSEPDSRGKEGDQARTGALFDGAEIHSQGSA